MKIKKIVILGASGNCIDILDAINELNKIDKTYKFLGFLDDNAIMWNKEIYGYKVLGGLDSANNYKDTHFVNGIGSPNNYWNKEKIIYKCNISEDRFVTIIHPRASVSEMSKIGFGSVIMQNVTVASNVRIGNHVMILPNSVINHNDVIEDYVSIASGVGVSGNVIVKKNSYLGSNSSIIGHITIGEKSLVGMGSVVLKDVQSEEIVVGNPARFLRNIST